MQKKSNRGEAANDVQTADFIIGRVAGNVLLSPALNPHHEGTAEHELWRQGHGAGSHAGLFGRKVGRRTLAALTPVPSAGVVTAFRAIPFLSCAA